MKHEKRELQKAVEQLEKGRDYFDQQIWEKEMQYAKKHEEVSFNQKRWRIPRVLWNKLKDAMTCKAANEKNLLKNFRYANLNIQGIVNCALKYLFLTPKMEFKIELCWFILKNVSNV